MDTIEENTDTIEDTTTEEIVEKPKSKRKPLTEEQKQKKRELIKLANEKRISLINAGKKALEEQSKPPPIQVKEEVIKKEITPKTIKPQSSITYETDEEPISEREIREYIRLKKMEEDNMKRIYLLKSQKEKEERYRLGYASLFNM